MIVYGYPSRTTQITTEEYSPLYTTGGGTLRVKYIDRWVTVIEYDSVGEVVIQRGATVICGSSQPSAPRSKNKTPWVILPQSMKRSLGTIPQPLGKPLKPRPSCLLRQP